MDPKLASASKVIRIWSTSDYSLLYSLPPPPSNCVKNVHWSWNSKQMISVAEESTAVTLVMFKDEKQISKDIILQGESPTFVQPSNTKMERFGVGTKNGTLLLWDIRHNKMLQSFRTDNNEVTCLQFNWNDSYVATGSSKGKISLHNIASGQSNKPFGNAGAHAITCLRYSFFINSLIGCTTYDGRVTLWDGNTRQQIHCFPLIHVAPATSLRFSPTNNLLLISAGLDKKIGLYDCNSKSVIKSVSFENPLTAFDFNDNGHTIALGDNSGKISICDLRNMKRPTNIIVADTSTIHYLSFQNSLFGNAARFKSAKYRPNKENSDIHHLSLVSEDSSKETKSNPAASLEKAPKPASILKQSRFSLTEEIFSPVKDDVIPHDNSKSDLKEELNDSFVFNMNKSVKRQSSLSLFSPLQNQSLLSFHSIEESPVLSRPSRPIISPIKRKLDPVQPRASLENGDHTNPSKWPTEKRDSPKCMSKLACLNIKGMCSTKSINLPTDEDKPLTNGHSSGNEKVTVVPPSLDSKRSPVTDINEVKLGFSEAVDEGHCTGTMPTPVTPHAFQMEHLKELLVDTIEERMDDVRRFFYMQNFQMFRQIQQLQDNMEGLFSRYAIDLDLATKVNELEKENRMLKTFHP